jgi:NAD-dependent DNA ligase
MQKIEPPKFCPSCDSLLEWRKDQLFCISDSCGVKSQKSIEHWAKTLKIKGLGPATIEKLNIDSVMDIYELDEDYIELALGSEKLATKLVVEIEKSKSSPLNKVLPAFGIPLIGNSVSGKLCSVISTLEELTPSKCKEAGLGPKATLNLMKWFEDEYEINIKSRMKFKPQTEKRVERVVANKGIVCISGKLSSVKTKAVAEKLLTELGYTVKSSLTKDVTILINESGIESAKTTKARKSGVTIVENLNDLLEK